MAHEHNTTRVNTGEGIGSLKSYSIGFVLSLILTLAAYCLVVNRTLSVWPQTLAISALAIAQVIVQLLFFLHLGKESSPSWNRIAFFFMLLVVAILVIGTLWIMYNLDYAMVDTMSSPHHSPPPY